MWKHGTVGDVLFMIQNGISCRQNKNFEGNKITRIETISEAKINFSKTGFALLNDQQKVKGELKKGDILFSHINSPSHVGKTAIYMGEEQLFHGINLLRLNTIKEVDSRYFNFFLRYLFWTGYWIKNSKQSINQASVNQTDIKSIPFSYPVLSEQKRIIAKLDDAFAEIDKAIVLSNRQALEANKLRYKIIRDEMINLGQKFGFSSIKDISTIQPKKKIALDKISLDDEVSFLKMNTLGVDTKFTEASETKLLNEVYNSYQYFEDNDVLFAKITPCFQNGKLSIVKNLKNKIGFGSSEFVVLRPNATIHSEFLYYALLDEDFRKKGQERMSGAVGHKRLTKEYFYYYKIPTPPIEIQIKIIKKLEKIWDMAHIILMASNKQNLELVNLKSAILSKEMRGSNV